MATMTEAQFNNLIIPAMKAHFVAEMERTQDIVGELFMVENTTNAYEKMVGLSGLGLMQRKNEGGAGEYDRMNQEYLTTFTPEMFLKNVPISRELVDDQSLLTLASLAREMGETVARTMQFEGAKVFNNAFATTTYGDGQFLCDTDHPLGANNATTASNNGTDALTHASLSAARTAMRKFKDPRGNPLGVMGDTLLVPPDLENTALEIVTSQLKAGTANNDRNVLSNIRVIVWDWLTDTNNWFLIDSRRAKRNLVWFNRQAPEITSHFDATSQNYIITISARWAYGVTDWRWVYGGEVA